MEMIESLFFSYDFSKIMMLLSNSISLLIESITLIISFIALFKTNSKNKKIGYAIAVTICLTFILLGFTSLYHTETISYFGDKLYFGETENGQACGFGRLYGELSDDGSRDLLYVGEFKENLYHGKGRLFSHITIDDQRTSYISYDGEFFEGQFHGNGNAFYYHQELQTVELNYSGEYRLGKFCGQGHYWGIDPNGNPFEYYGGFYKNEYYGYGTLIYHNSDGEKRTYVGLFSENKRDNEGIEYYENGSKMYEGQFEDGFYCGYGLFYNKDGSLLYCGYFKDGVFEGTGTYYSQFSGTNEPALLKGHFENGEKEGEFLVYNSSGKLICIQIYKDNKLIQSESA